MAGGFRSGWTELTLNVDWRGSKLLLEIDEGPAQIGVHGRELWVLPAVALGQNP